MSFSITNTTTARLPRVRFKKAKETVLGTRYALSVVFVTPKKMRELNRVYRKKDAPTDILAFPLSESSGEIYLCLSEVKKKAPVFGMSAATYLPYLFVHGLVHLKGHDHGKKMDALEKKYCALMKIPKPG